MPKNIIEYKKAKKTRLSFLQTSNNVLSWVLAVVLAFIVTLPIFILLHRVLPYPNLQFPIDRIGLFVVLYLVWLFVFRKIKFVSYILAGALIIGLAVGSLTNEYGYSDIYKDYQGLIYSFSHDPKPVEDLVSQMKPFPHKQEIKDAVEFKNPDVRKFAQNAVKNHFLEFQKGEYRYFIQYFAVFKEINSRWLYIKDPKSEEYLAKASETVELLSGDCDDHSIFMAACIMSIGGTVRLVRTEDHIYPELRIGNKADMDNLHYLIREELFPIECGDKTLYYHVDANNVIWLNLDYTEHYPGGAFMPGTIIGTL